MLAILKYWRLWLAIAIVVCLGLFVRGYGQHAYARGKAEVQAEFDGYKVAQANATAKLLQQQQEQYNSQLEQANAKHQANLQAAQAAANNARAAAASLREQIGAANRNLSTATRPTIVKYATASSDLLGECSAAYQELAGKADGHVADIRLMQDAWPRGKHD